MELKLYQIDAFANQIFEGNPAAVCPLDAWLPDKILQAIAMENNLSETAYFVPAPQGYQLRWFAPRAEVDMCGHATLAAAYVLFNILGYENHTVYFQTRSGLLAVTRKDDWLEMDFPVQPVIACDTPEPILKAFDGVPQKCLRAMDYIVVFDEEAQVYAAQPDLMQLSQLDLRGVAITSRSRDYDFISRFFAPKVGINEDPVTGSAFTQLAPYWSSILGKSEFLARQVSARGGDVRCSLEGDRIRIAGKAAIFKTATIHL